MDHVNTGIRRYLEFPQVYLLFQRLLGSARSTERFAAESIRPFPGAWILDIGCGPAMILDHLPRSVHYVGYDFNPRYIEYARKRHSDRGEFICRKVSEAPRHDLLGQFDIVLAIAILHHLNDAEAAVLIETAHAHLKPGGTLITLDGAYVSGQPLIAKFLLARDRGRHVRTPEGYVSLLRSRFDDVETKIRHDALLLPYTHFITRCTKSDAEREFDSGPSPGAAPQATA